MIRDPKGKFKTQALLCTDLNIDPVQTPALAAGASVIKWFVLRWQLEVTYHEVREHLGVETQRQWSDLAILRTTPALLALFSLVTLPVEFNASHRAKALLQSYQLVSPDELMGVNKVLDAAALTYVAGLASALSTLLYYVFILTGSRGRRR